jgi:hypothetical protein
MAKDIREQNLLYHLTDIDNLESILRGGLKPRRELMQFSDVADCDILESRRVFDLDNMVPFHFFARNPFDGRVQEDHPNKDFVLITVLRALAKSNNWQIIPCHPLSNSALQLLNYQEGIEAIDWNAMNARDYHNDLSKSVGMAECLAPSTIESNRFHSIFVRNDKLRDRVIELVSNSTCNAYINVNPLMFLARK